jgi:hypothetical protein
MQSTWSRLIYGGSNQFRLPAFLRFSLRERIEVREIFWFLSPAADALDAFHQATGFCRDITWKVAAFSLNYFQCYKKFAI